MPYIITTHTPDEAMAGTWYDQRITRRAVATLDQARDYLHERIGESYATLPLDADWNQTHYAADAHADCVADGTSRLPVGPLPDGTVIEVTPISLQRLFDEMRHAMMLPSEAATEAELIDAYNAAQGEEV